MKVSIYIFVLSMLTVGSVVAQENVASALRTSTAAGAVTVTNQIEDTISEALSTSEGRVSSIGSREQPALRPDHSQTSHSGAQTFDFQYGDDRIKRTIDERTIDRLGLFDRPDDGGSGRCGVSLDLENEDSDWTFEVTVTVEF